MSDGVSLSCPADDSSVACDDFAEFDQPSDADFHQLTVPEVVTTMEEVPPSVSYHDTVSHDDTSPCLGLNNSDNSKQATNISQEYDLGEFLDKAKLAGIPDNLKLRLLTNPWSPNSTYCYGCDGFIYNAK